MSSRTEFRMSDGDREVGGEGTVSKPKKSTSFRQKLPPLPQERDLDSGRAVETQEELLAIRPTSSSSWRNNWILGPV